MRNLKCNGMFEQAVMSVEEQVKVMKSALEAKWQT